MGICISYRQTLSLLDEISKQHTAPLSKWINTKTPFIFWGDNLDKQRTVRDMRTNHRGELMHMYSILAGATRTTDPSLSHHENIADVSSISSVSFLPTDRYIIGQKKLNRIGSQNPYAIFQRFQAITKSCIKSY